MSADAWGQYCEAVHKLRQIQDESNNRRERIRRLNQSVVALMGREAKALDPVEEWGGPGVPVPA
jgi:hypothetical protein